MTRFTLLVCGLLFAAALSVAAPVEQEQDAHGKPRFLDDLFADITSGMDMNVSKIVQQGGSIVKKVQSSQGGGTIIKTEITQSSYGTPGLRFKRGVLLDKLEGLVDTFGVKLDKVKDKLAGAAADAYNLGAEATHKLKGKL